MTFMHSTIFRHAAVVAEAPPTCLIRQGSGRLIKLENAVKIAVCVRVCVCVCVRVVASVYFHAMHTQLLPNCTHNPEYD